MAFCQNYESLQVWKAGRQTLILTKTNSTLPQVIWAMLGLHSLANKAMEKDIVWEIWLHWSKFFVSFCFRWPVVESRPVIRYDLFSKACDWVDVRHPSHCHQSGLYTPPYHRTTQTKRRWWRSSNQKNFPNLIWIWTMGLTFGCS